MPRHLLNEEQAQINHEQSLDTLERRGGLSIREAWLIANRRPIRDFGSVTDEQAWKFFANAGARIDGGRA